MCLLSLPVRIIPSRAEGLGLALVVAGAKWRLAMTASSLRAMKPQSQIATETEKI